MSRSLAKTTLSRCRSCSYLPSTSRAFSTSQPLSKVGPERPDFIEVPKLDQPHKSGGPIVKGVLPVPRTLFPRKGDGNKTSLDHLASTTPEPVSEKQLQEAATPYIQWKRNMAEKRRANFREGIVGLYERRQEQTAFMESRSRAKQGDRKARLEAPIREDERLMNSTITAESSRRLSHISDPNREARVKTSVAKYNARQEAKADQRRDALHTLYMNARQFITTEAQLDEEVEKLFIERPFADIYTAEHATGHIQSNDIWEAIGAPPTVQELLRKSSGGQRTYMEAHRSGKLPVNERMLRLSEELTGGKL